MFMDRKTCFVTMSVLPDVICIFNAIPIKTPASNFVDIDN